MLQKSVETQQALQPHPAPSEWLDAAENHELLPPPKAKVIPQKPAFKGVKSVDKTQEAIKYLLFSESYSAEQVCFLYYKTVYFVLTLEPSRN